MIFGCKINKIANIRTHFHINSKKHFMTNKQNFICRLSSLQIETQNLTPPRLTFYILQCCIRLLLHGLTITFVGYFRCVNVINQRYFYIAVNLFQIHLQMLNAKIFLMRCLCCNSNKSLVQLKMYV